MSYLLGIGEAIFGLAGVALLVGLALVVLRACTRYFLSRGPTPEEIVRAHFEAENARLRAERDEARAEREAERKAHDLALYDLTLEHDLRLSNLQAELKDARKIYDHSLEDLARRHHDRLLAELREVVRAELAAWFDAEER